MNRSMETLLSVFLVLLLCMAWVLPASAAGSPLRKGVRPG